MELRKFQIYGFILGGCTASDDQEKFLGVWSETNGDPCSVCSGDKSECLYYKELAALSFRGGRTHSVARSERI